jgi:hypothetical protein
VGFTNQNNENIKFRHCTLFKHVLETLNIERLCTCSILIPGQGLEHKESSFELGTCPRSELTTMEAVQSPRVLGAYCRVEKERAAWRPGSLSTCIRG